MTINPKILELLAYYTFFLSTSLDGGDRGCLNAWKQLKTYHDTVSPRLLREMKDCRELIGCFVAYQLCIWSMYHCAGSHEQGEYGIDL